MTPYTCLMACRYQIVSRKYIN